MKPPSGGPRIGPSSAGIVRYDSTLTSSLFSTLFSRTSRPTGTIIAPPIPCTKRATTKPPSELEKPQASEPNTKTAIAQRNTVRDP